MSEVERALESVVEHELGPHPPYRRCILLTTPEWKRVQAALHSLKSGEVVVVKGWRSISDELPPVGQSVLFVSIVNGAFSDLTVGEWTGEETEGNAIVMDYGDPDDWLPCTHWMPLPPIPEG